MTRKPLSLIAFATAWLAFGCDSSLPHCDLDDSKFYAVLRFTDEPRFSKDLVEPGEEDLVLTIPVEARTRRVHVAVHPVDDPTRRLGSSRRFDTEGGEDIEVPMQTRYAPGDYTASILFGGETGEFFTTYDVRAGIDRYVLLVEQGTCITDVALPTYTVLPE